jgi:hypothetical protein
MSRLHVTALLVLSALALPASASAQVIFGPGMQGVSDRANHGRATERDDIYTCQGAPGGSRVRENCDAPETETVRLEQEIKLSFMLNAPPPIKQCGATTTTAYQQRDTVARVNSTLEIRDCTAASGTFTVAIVVKHEDGTEEPLEFRETWQRSDDQNVIFTADYPIGENMELGRVRLSGLTCTCADPAAEEQSLAED